MTNVKIIFLIWSSKYKYTTENLFIHLLIPIRNIYIYIYIISTISCIEPYKIRTLFLQIWKILFILIYRNLFAITTLICRQMFITWSRTPLDLLHFVYLFQTRNTKWLVSTYLVWYPWVLYELMDTNSLQHVTTLESLTIINTVKVGISLIYLVVSCYHVLIYGWKPLMVRHHLPMLLAIGRVQLGMWNISFITWLHQTNYWKNGIILWVKTPHWIYHHAKFGGHSYCDSRDMSLICQVL